MVMQNLGVELIIRVESDRRLQSSWRHRYGTNSEVW